MNSYQFINFLIIVKKKLSIKEFKEFVLASIYFYICIAIFVLSIENTSLNNEVLKE